MLRWTLRRKLVALIVGPTVLIYILILGLAMLALLSENRRQISAQNTQLAVNYAARFDAALQRAAAIADATAGFLDNCPDLSEEQLYQQLEKNVRQIPYIYGAALAFKPGTYLKTDALYSPYVHRAGDALARINIDDSVYDWYRDDAWQWFRGPMKTERPMWSDVYFDEGAGNVLMVTYSAPFFRDGQFRGVATVDIELPRLNETIGRHIVGDLNFYVLAPDGRYVYSSAPGMIGRNALEAAREEGREDLVGLVERATSGATGMAELRGVGGADSRNEVFWVFHAPIESAHWGFAISIPQSVALAPVHRRMIVAGVALTLTLALIVVAVLLVSGRIAGPVAALRAQVARVAEGDIDAKVSDPGTTDEVGDLARAFNGMTAELRMHIDRIAQESAARQKIERDLDLAREIQRGLLPTELPKLPGYAVAGWNQPAEQCGGDYFDWMTLPDGKTIFVLADVTGHGIGPALIVSVCRAYLRAASQADAVPLAQVMQRVNDFLAHDIPETHFVTAVVAVIAPSDHSMILTSAGHGPILLYHAATGVVDVMGADYLPFAVMAGVDFPEPRAFALGPGDTLLLTTDGFFEWMNAAGERYGVERLRAFLADNHSLEPEALIRRLHEEVLAHASGTSQDDDLTAVVVKRLA
jgi:sigma-B regulation protein RsbU (phosphoserine phosphatase)